MQKTVAQARASGCVCVSESVCVRVSKCVCALGKDNARQKHVFNA